MARAKAPGTRDRILETASRLFLERGVRAVGLQQIIDECGCGKNLLYREFPTKDDLVAAYLQRCQLRWDAIMADATAPHAGDAASQMVALVQAAVGQVAAPGFRACPFRATFAEFPDDTHPARAVAVQHVRKLHRRLRELAKEAGADDPHALADRIALIIDGIYGNGAMLGAKGPRAQAVTFAQELVHASTQPRDASRRPRR